MKSSFHRPLTALFVASVLIVGKDAVAIAQDNSAPPSMHSMDQWATDQAALLDAKLAGLKAGLKLTPDQEMLWAPFETAVREAAKMRMEHMHGMIERMGKMGSMDMGADMNMDEGHLMSPIDRLDMMATHLTEAGTALKKVADTAKPLYASLDSSQKRIFGFLAHEMMMIGHGRGMMRGSMMGYGGMMGPHSHHGEQEEDEGGPDEQ
jgi:zinc resistance-associated protein